MKSSDLILIAMAAGVLLFVVTKTGKTPLGAAMPTPGQAGVPANAGSVSEIMNPNGGAWSNGWQYFSDGTSISPDGKYYYQGNLAYDPASLFGN
ncbi:hypothetical protein D9X30_4906 [Cupriavidus sp. U2]|uniref:hypothetical protein n=1 Tax=Cupriavidus sp. U2 TaxID=2920269 RepID=UPI00129DBAF1|nr:hypothetical protein [Cupriavidus sp. U2]KAI3589323.1 hypothetical protein D9X30_4906 [Cupriavidus sp. U2]